MAELASAIACILMQVITSTKIPLIFGVSYDNVEHSV